jgi:ketol-acid reductoisomerase
MKQALTAIQDGSFAREWIAEMDKGSPILAESRKELAAKEIEIVGKRLRALGHRDVQVASQDGHGVG